MVRTKQTIHKFHLGFYLPALHIGFFVLRSFRELGYLGYTLYVVIGHCGSGVAIFFSCVSESSVKSFQVVKDLNASQHYNFLFHS